MIFNLESLPDEEDSLMHPASDTSDVLPDLEDAMEELNQAAAQRKESGAAGSKYDIYYNYCTFIWIF